MKAVYQSLITFGVLCISFVLISQSQAFADFTPATPDSTLVATMTPTPTPVDYTMPYPGLLPDNPFYKLKTLRDRLVSLLISNPSTKAQFDILQADKRFAGAQMLWELRPSQKQLSLDTLSKADNYMEEAIGSIKNAKSQGMHYTDPAWQALRSNRKHQEILLQLQSEMGPNTTLMNESKRVASFITRIQSSFLQ